MTNSSKVYVFFIQCKFLFIFFFVILPIYSFSQSENPKDTTSLQYRAGRVQLLLISDMEEAYNQIKPLLKEARHKEDQKIEIQLLSNLCRYSFHKQDADGLMLASNNLYRKAFEYNDLKGQARSKMYMAEAFKFNELYDDAIKELEKALDILSIADSLEHGVINTKSNVYISFANTYSFLKNPKMAVEMMKKGGAEFAKFPQGDYKEYLNYLYHSNLGIYFADLNTDSSEFHAEKSIRIKPKHIPEDDNITLINLYTLGIVWESRGQYDKAIEYLSTFEERALKIGEVSNLEEAYKLLISIAEKRNDEVMLKLYQGKLQTLEITKIKNKNESLHKIIQLEKGKQNTLAQEKNKTILIWTGIILLVSGVIVIFSIYIYKNRIRQKYERISQDYLNEHRKEQEINLDLYNEIIELLKREDSSFMTAFNKIFPEFTDRLLKVNSNLVKGEVEFCAMLKLNLTTKQIAQLRVLQPRTVQNKKYQIRKKLNIPNNIDIYNWIHEV